MIKISKSLTHLANLSPSLASSLAPYSALAQPIIVTGCINKQALLADKEAQIVQMLDKYQPLKLAIGIDEVGRGTLYGSVVVAAVILPNCYADEIELAPLKGTKLAQLTDSKKLTETKRRQLCPLIKQAALGYMIVEVPAAVIDAMNILQATMTAMRLAGEQLIIETAPLIEQCLQNGKSILNWQIRLLIDGNKVPDIDWQRLKAHGAYPDSGDTENFDRLNRLNRLSNKKASVSVRTEAWIKGDARHTAIAAASVLAKVSRDQQLLLDDALYPGYGLAQHKGYPTKAHIAAIHALGVLPLHRRSFKPIQQALAGML